MTNLTPVPGWDAVPQIDTTAQLVGGPGGALNTQAQALLDRTEAIAQGTLLGTGAVTGAEVVTVSKSGSVYQTTLAKVAALASGSSLALSGLTDVSVTEGVAINGYSLTWNNATGKWVATNPTMVASGAGHAGGAVPDPGAAAGTTRFLREDATWVVPPYPSVMGASGASHASGLVPDPGASAGTTHYLREDGTWAVPSGGGGGLPDFTDTLNTASPNATIPVAQLAATNGATNVDFNVAPQAAGAFILGPVPDSTTTGGNKRGSNAVDLQMVRTIASNVASGNNSIAAGSDCKASGANSVAMGYSAWATAQYAVAMGASHTVSATGGMAFGSTNTVSGQYGVGIGYSHTVSGQFSVALGRMATTNGISGAVAIGSAASSGVGQKQRTFLNLSCTTTSSTQTAAATSDGSAAATTNQLVLRYSSAGSAFRVTLKAVAYDITNKTDAKEWSGDILIIRTGSSASTVAIVGSPTIASTFATAGASGWSIAVSADTTNGALKVTCTGSATDQVNWSVSLDSVEAAW